MGPKSVQNLQKVIRRPPTSFTSRINKTILKVHIRAHFAHVFELQAFSKSKVEKTICNRHCVQIIQFSEHNFDFRSGLEVEFESITKPQREAQNGQWEYTVQTLSQYYTRCRKVHAKSVIIVQTFGPECAKGRASR